MKILIIGDLILDEYMRGYVTRISPEAPVPILDNPTSQQALGGAANVAHNLVDLGCTVVLCGVVGNDNQGGDLLYQLSLRQINTGNIAVIPERPTTHKLRVTSQVQHLLRIDREVKNPLPLDVEKSLMSFVGNHVNDVDGIIISDYRKGVLSINLVAYIIMVANTAKKQIVVDPKGDDFSRYYGAHVLTPNMQEVARATGIRVESTADLNKPVGNLFDQTEATGILVTCGKDGMVLFHRKGGMIIRAHIPSEAKEVYDVTGAGDTVVAAFSMAYFGGKSALEAAQLANKAAGIVVGKLGTATVTQEELGTCQHEKTNIPASI